MKYYINGQEVTKEEAEKQDKINQEIMKIEDIGEWLKEAHKCNFIVTINK